MTPATRAWVIGLWAVLASATGHAETVDDAYRAAMKEYYAGHYETAVQSLERMTELPLHHEELFYNLGCAYVRLGKVGPGIYNFERALALDPAFDDARYNLGIARKLATSRVKDVLRGADADPWWVWLAKLLSLPGWWTVVLLVWWLVIGIIVLLRYVGHGPARAGLLAGNGLLVLVLLCSALLLSGRLHLATGSPEAVILADKVAAREGPDATARSTFQLHSGLRVRVKGKSAGWVHIRLANGLEGWVEQRKIGTL